VSRCVEGGISYRPHGSRFQITASATDAPESCGSFYWDPLLQAVPGDGASWELVAGGGSGASMSPGVIGGIAAGAGVGGLAIVLALIWFCKRRKANHPGTAKKVAAV